MLTRSFDCDLDGVVVAVAVGVDALPEDGEVFFGTQPVRMESMASTERFSTGQIKQRRHLVFKLSLRCLFITQNFDSKEELKIRDSAFSLPVAETGGFGSSGSPDFARFWK